MSGRGEILLVGWFTAMRIESAAYTRRYGQFCTGDVRNDRNGTSGQFRILGRGCKRVLEQGKSLAGMTGLAHLVSALGHDADVAVGRRAMTRMSWWGLQTMALISCPPAWDIARDPPLPPARWHEFRFCGPQCNLAP